MNQLRDDTVCRNKKLNPTFLTQKLHFVTELEDAQDENSAICYGDLGAGNSLGENE